ncbi:MAG: hypothetical protein O2975_09005, partial [Proteobacteria bacterium]|nr:hypothetical protein [Pseudomonadota bacterium]
REKEVGERSEKRGQSPFSGYTVPKKGVRALFRSPQVPELSIPRERALTPFFSNALAREKGSDPFFLDPVFTS